MSKAAELAKFIGSGEIARTSHPAFMIRPTSTQSNIPINATTTVVFDNEIFDQGSNFASNTFTAPITGKYQFDVHVYVQNMDTAANYVQCTLKTSNRVYYDIIEPVLNNDVDYFTFQISVLADMDASDTAHVEFDLDNSGSAQMDVQTNSHFSGYLVA
ncbi:MAG: hypothetical protein CBC71_05680 [Rhodobacteraceae bacterium TMED111]|nr:MAG: hypothetical protein CBC71_05680 [Rhodobacteraceae bacterium TMED111]|tara:strand:+ start:1809 stop:2282 length:474 start_codon:yes stop_codon:yes gene_type:complete